MNIYFQYLFFIVMKVQISDECKKAFDSLKFGHTYRYLVFKINKTQGESIDLERSGEKTQNWESFINSLPKEQFRYTVFDIEFTNKEGMKISKVFFCNWNPDDAPLKNRVAYASAKQSFRNYLDCGGKQITLSSAKDVKSIQKQMNEAELIKQFDK